MSDNELLIRIDSIDQLFNAPAIDPFSDKPAVILGEAALPYSIRQELSRGLRFNRKRLVIQLPAAQITPDLQSKTAGAVRCYSAAKQAENNALIRISRWRSVAGLIVAIAIALVIIIFATIVLNTLLASASDPVKAALIGIVTIFIWATVWNPWERLVYDWMPPWMENRILRQLMRMEIVIQPEPFS